MTRRTISRLMFGALLLTSISCSKDSTSPAEVADLTGFWSGRFTYDVSESCTLLGCYYDSRMMIVQTGNSVTGWFRTRANIESTQTPITGTVTGDTLSLLVNVGQVTWTGAMKFQILSNGKNIVARQDKKTINLTME